MTIPLIIDGVNCFVQTGSTLLAACQETNHYVPALCAHPNLPTTGECGLCLVELSTQKEPVLACVEKAAEGASIISDSPNLRKLRQERLSQILKNHPHVCLTCPHQDGCDRTECTLGFSPAERCCFLFGKCEIQKVSNYIGILPDTPPYRPANLPVWEKDPVIRLNLELCIGCMRCVDACSKVMGYHALTTYILHSRTLVKPSGQNLTDGFKESGCRFCGACVEVCPAGAVTEYGINGSRWRGKTKNKLNFSSLPSPPRKTYPLDLSSLSFVPEESGIYRLWNEKGGLFLIEGSPNLKDSLKKEIEDRGNGFTFDFEASQFYTQRMNELLQTHLKKEGKLPEGNELFDDLY